MSDERFAETAPEASPYDRIAGLYDPWSRSVTEDIAFYVAEARKAAAAASARRAAAAVEPRDAAGGAAARRTAGAAEACKAPGALPAAAVVELGVGTGRIAVPTAEAGVPVIGVDSSAAMLEVCRARARDAGVAGLLALRLGDLRDPPVTERVPLVTCPFRAYLHLADDRERLAALRAARALLVTGGRLIFDVFTPSREDIDETDARWLEREPGIWERADWDERARRLTLSVRSDATEATMELSWLAPAEWSLLLARAGFEVEACYGWFDRRPYEGGEDSIWIARRI